MDRIGVFRDAYRLQNRRIFRPAPVPFWHRVFPYLLAVGLVCFLSGFAAGKAQAAAGSVQFVVECVPKVPNSGGSTAPCVTFGGNRYVPSMAQRYVIDPAYQSAFEDWVWSGIALSN